MRRTLAIVLAWLLLAATAAFGLGAPLPSGQSSDEAAWRTFAEVVGPAEIPGSTSVGFETWASDDDIYRATPPRWPAIGSPKVLRPGMGQPEDRAGHCAPPGRDKVPDFPADACLREEVRRNWASFHYIVSNHLDSRAGLAAAARKTLIVDFPAASIEIKADWMSVRDLRAWQHDSLSVADIRARYHTNVATDGTGSSDYALVALHISTKQLKSWIWSDFENELNPGRCDDIGCHDDFGATIKTVVPKNLASPTSPSEPTDNQNYGACVKSLPVEAILKQAHVGGVWRHYCLKGSQTDFLTPDGRPSLLGSSVIERLNSDIPVKRSSCITCHAAAAFRPDGTPDAVPDGPTGRLSPRSSAGLTQSDFVWGIVMAR